MQSSRRLNDPTSTPRPQSQRNGRTQKHADEISGRLAAIVESSDDAIISKTLEGIITTWNPAAACLYGYTADEAIGRSISMLIPPQRSNELPDILKRLLRGEHIRHFDTVRLHKDGRWLDVSVAISPIVDSAGAVVGASVIARDVAERRQIEDQVRALNVSLEQRVRERTEEIEARARQQAAVAALGQRAVKGEELQVLMHSAVSSVATTLEVAYSSVYKLLSTSGELLMTTAVGRGSGIDGKDKADIGGRSLAAFTLSSGDAVVVEDFQADARFTESLLRQDQPFKSAVSVIIHGPERPFGVLAAMTRGLRVFTSDDIHFMQSVANIIGSANERSAAERVARNRTVALIQTLNALTTSPELDTFLGQVLTTLTQFLDAPSATLWFYDLAEYSLSLHMVSHENRIIPGDLLKRPMDRLFVLPHDIPFWRDMLARQGPLVVNVADAAVEATYFQWLHSRGYQNVLIVPLLLGDEAIGWFGVRSVEERIYRSDELEFAQALAQQATLAMRLTRLAGQEKQAAILEERTRVAQEIHDTIAQGLTGILVQMSAADSAPTDKPEATKDHIARARELAKESLAEARRSVQALRPLALEGHTLSNAFSRLADRMTAGTSVRTEFHVHGAARVLDPDTEANLLRIGMEALTNSLRHSGATEVTLTLTNETKHTKLSIRDNGRGFDVASIAGGFGMTGMRERATKVGGSIDITSRVGSGTEVIVSVPADTCMRRKGAS